MENELYKEHNLKISILKQWENRTQRPVIHSVWLFYSSTLFLGSKQNLQLRLVPPYAWKRAIKEHISFIPGNFPNPCWAAGERKTLWMWVSRWWGRDFEGSAQVCVAMCASVIWIHLHYCVASLITAFFFYLVLVLISVFMCLSMCMYVC